MEVMKYQETVGELCKSSPVKTKTLNLIHFIYSSSLYSLRLSTRRGKKNEICDLQKKKRVFQQAWQWVILLDAKFKANKAG